MKKFYLMFLGISMSLLSYSQHVSKTMQHGGLSRQYLEYVPQIYDGSSSVPLLICLHGLGDNMNNFKNIRMDAIADTANFIVLTPQAQSSVLGTAWNSGASMSGMQLNENVDDVGFIISLIDSTSALYNIDPARVYLTGFSMGSFMCHRMACERTDRIAAIASVAGTIGSALQCSPSRPMPVIHFHGTADGTIAYSGNQYGMDVDTLLNFWVGVNNCNAVPIHTEMPDIAADGFTVDHYLFGNGNAGSNVEHYKVNGAGHQWIYHPAHDIDYSSLIWNFLSKQRLTQLNVGSESFNAIEVFPNPNSGFLQLKLSGEPHEIAIFSVDGRLISFQMVNEKEHVVDMTNMSHGFYVIHAKNLNSGVVSKSKILKN